MRYVLGVDIGGTSFSIGSVAEDGSRIGVLLNEPTRPEGGADDVVNRICALAREVIRRLPSRCFSSSFRFRVMSPP